MNISAAVMAHPDRAVPAKAIERKLSAMPFTEVNIIYDDSNIEWDTGRRSLEWGIGKADWHIVIQDDAIISENFYRNAVSAINASPHKTLISFYTGRVRPYPSLVQKAVATAEAGNSSFIKADRLMWGVGIATPTEQIAPVLNYVSRFPTLPYDQRIGAYYNHKRLPVLYTYPSIVDHDYNLGSLIKNDFSPEPRVAHRYEPNVVTFNSDLVAMN